MKRTICFLLSLLLLLIFCGCKKEVAQDEDSISFYYPLAELSYQAGSSAIAAEPRQNEQWGSWAQVLNIYLKGPLASTFYSPFPAGLQVTETRMENGTLHITVSQQLADLTGLPLTIACGSMAMTCLELTGAETVIIRAENGLLDGQKSITMDKNTLLLLDLAEGE